VVCEVYIRRITIRTFAEQNAFGYDFVKDAKRGVLVMIDSKILAQELDRARRARSEAEDAWCAVEELLWEVGRGPRSWRRLAQVDAGEPEPLALPH
jgi:hypothetical protein